MITRVSDVLAGVLLVNTLPHVVRGLGGKRGLTPFGEDSSPGANLGWAALNAAGATALLVAGGWRRIDDARAAERLVRVEAGVLGMATFGMAYELTGGRRKRTARQP
ncbi:MAG TPA: hypothetical protein VD903_14315 [Pseudonocardia sp.]|nr:hypothetical protein [Pseudonocardia sp.]